MRICLKTNKNECSSQNLAILYYKLYKHFLKYIYLFLVLISI